MLVFKIPDREYFDEQLGEFKKIPGMEIRMEHSLLSISKWESKWKKPFLSDRHPKTEEEIFDYYRCMCLKDISVETIKYGFPPAIQHQIAEYMKDSHTATWFSEKDEKKAGASKEIVTSEIIYWSMLQHNIPFEFEKWNINRLLTLIKVCNIKQAEAQPKRDGKKMSKAALYAQHNKINQMNRAKSKAKG